MKNIILIFLMVAPMFSFADDLTDADCSSTSKDHLINCQIIRHKDYDTIMNMIYQDLRSSMNKGIFDELKQVQRLWLRVYDKECNEKYSDNSYGNETEIYRLVCIAEQVQERNRELSIIKELNQNIFRKYTLEKSKPKINHKEKWNIYLQQHCDFMLKNYNDLECFERNRQLHSTDFG